MFLSSIELNAANPVGTKTVRLVFWFSKEKVSTEFHLSTTELIILIINSNYNSILYNDDEEEDDEDNDFHLKMKRKMDVEMRRGLESILNISLNGADPAASKLWCGKTNIILFAENRPIIFLRSSNTRENGC